MKAPIYLDNHATTPVDPRVRDAIVPWLGERFGNAGSRTHPYGWAADEAVTRARTEVASMVGATPEEIVFTAGSTEGCNIVIQGLLAKAREPRRIITAATEHHAVLDTCEHLARQGVEVIVLGVDAHGRIDLAELTRQLDRGASLVSLMAANNEIGTVHRVEEIGRLARQRGVPFHCDAAQAGGRMPIDVAAWGCDWLTLSAHKFYGPQGVGVLVARAKAPRLAPLMHGGGQERGLRPGTLAVPGIVGIGAAAAICATDVVAESARIAAHRDRLERALVDGVPGVRINGDREHRLCGNLSVTFDGVEAEALMLAVPRLALSAGSACTSGTTHVSPVLRAIGLTPKQAQSTVRFGLGRFTTEAEVDEAASLVVAACARLR